MNRNPIQKLVTSSYEPPENAQYTIVRGTTNSGKSTLINFLMGVRLKFEKSKTGIAIFPDQQSDSLPQIGNKSVTCTLRTTPYTSNGRLFIDTPGVKSTQSIEDQFANTIADSKLYLKGRKINEILMINICDLMATNAALFKECVQHLVARYDDENTFKCVCLCTILIISKSSSDDSLQDIIETIRDLITAKQVSKKAAVLLKFLIENRKVLLFPSVKSPRFQESQEIIWEAAYSLRFHELYDNFPSIPSSEVQLWLRKNLQANEKNLEKLCSKMMKQIDEFCKNLQKKYEETTMRKLMKARALLLDEDLLTDFSIFTEFFKLMNVMEYEQVFFSEIGQISYFSQFLPHYHISPEILDQMVSGLQVNIREMGRRLEQTYDKKRKEELERELGQLTESYFQEKKKNLVSKLQEKERQIQKYQQQQIDAMSRQFEENQKRNADELRRQQDQYNHVRAESNKVYIVEEKSNSWSLLDFINPFSGARSTRKRKSIFQSSRQSGQNRQYQYPPQSNIYSQNYTHNPYQNYTQSYTQNYTQNPHLNYQPQNNLPNQKPLKVPEPMRQYPRFEPAKIPEPPSKEIPRWKDLSEYERYTDDPQVLRRQVRQLKELYEQEKRQIEAAMERGRKC